MWSLSNVHSIKSVQGNLPMDVQYQRVNIKEKEKKGHVRGVMGVHAALHALLFVHSFKYST